MLLLRNSTTICDYEPYELKTLILKILIRAVTFVQSMFLFDFPNTKNVNLSRKTSPVQTTTTPIRVSKQLLQ